MSSEDGRCGTVTLVGRPNAGKSTLLNRLLGEKVAIVSGKPQTTRHRLVGILSSERGQIVFYDTPGIHRPMHRMNRIMVQHARDAMVEGDVLCLLVDAATPFGSGDAYLLEQIRALDVDRILVLNKVDLVAKEKLLPTIARYAETRLFSEIVPLSAATGDGCDLLLDLLFTRLPVAPPRYDPELVTVHPERFLAAEWIREKILELTREEVPFSSAVIVDRWEEVDERSLVKIFASILVERPGQKGILLGKGGRQIKRLGTAARLDLEDLLGRRVYLDLHVRVEPRWRENRRILSELETEVFATAWDAYDDDEGESPT